MEARTRMAKAGFVLAIIGLAIALLGIVPAVVKPGGFPWPLIVGSSIYLPGAFIVMIGSRGPQMKEAMGKLRFVRMGFILVFAVAVYQLFGA